MLEAGKLSRQVTIQQRAIGSPQRTAMGAPDDACVDLCTTWAAIRPASSRALFAAQAVESLIDTEIEIRYCTDVTAAMRVVYGSTIYNIEGVRDWETRHERLFLDCSTG